MLESWDLGSGGRQSWDPARKVKTFVIPHFRVRFLSCVPGRRRHLLNKWHWELLLWMRVPKGQHGARPYSVATLYGTCVVTPSPPPRLLLTHILTYRVIGLISCSLPSCNLPIRPSDRAGFVSGNHQDLSWQLEQNLQRRGDESQVGSFLNVQPAGAGT